MVEHIVLLKLKEGATKDQTQALADGLDNLKKVIPGILEVSAGYNNSIEGKAAGFNYGFIVRFKDAAARDGYVPHPEHQKLAVTLVRPIADDVVVFDYES